MNPITGAHRTAAHVRNELNAFKNRQRASAEIAPVYQSDYIFFTVRGKGVKLGRVVSAPYGGALKHEDMLDVTEYEHVPQPGVNGYFGTFRSLRNEAHNEKTRGSTVFVRHRDVKRADIVVFNVQMQGSGEHDLRVTLDSLRKLANAMPDTHKIPSVIPSTHKKGNVGGAHLASA